MRRKKIGRHIVVFLFMLQCIASTSQEVNGFERLNTQDGLSQNTILSSFCDSNGFLWFGTMDGLNRYDGSNFTIYRKKNNDPFSLSSNRIVRIWEDSNQFIWVESHDGHYHYLNQTNDKFYSFPEFEELKGNDNVRITSFLQPNKNEVWLGTDETGIYRLTLNEQGIYDHHHISAIGINSISNNTVNFIIADASSNVWVGTDKGINQITAQKGKVTIQHYFINHSFTCATISDDKMWFGTLSNGLIVYDIANSKFTTETFINKDVQITSLTNAQPEHLIIGTRYNGLKIYNPSTNKIFSYFDGQYIKQIFKDSKGAIWLITDKPGISRLNIVNPIEQHYRLTPEEKFPYIINERQVFFETQEGDIWIGTHGGGLAQYNTKKSTMQFYRNNPNDNSTISSDVIHSITQDQAGIIWVGTGQPNGGLNKLIPSNPMFQHLEPENQVINISDNFIKGLLQDSKNNIWASTKSGHIFIYNESFQLITELKNQPNTEVNIPESHIYSIMQDNDGYIWLGSKGKGVAVSKKPLNYYNSYNDIQFNKFKHIPSDDSSLSSDLVYSIIQDHSGKVWIGTYGGGLNLVQSRNSSKLYCSHFNTLNSNLSSNNIRQVYEDSSNRIWLATTYGLNVTSKNDSIHFISFTNNINNEKSISYNDIVSIYEDSQNQLWFGTFGGGVNYFIDSNHFDKGFYHLSTEDGLINNSVFGITNDKNGNIWFSTQNGISRFQKKRNTFNSYDASNGLSYCSFSENSSLLLANGSLLFGNTNGLLIVKPDKDKVKSFKPKIALTNFLLFNKEVNINDENSPLEKNINYTDKITLEHNQSSFSIEYSALSYFDTKKNQYAYTLENFDDNWYEVKNDTKASYTNIPPGDYIFKVKAANWDGSWNDIPRELKIKIQKPWWGTHLAYAFYFILIIIILYLLRRTYINYHSLQTDLKVEKRVNEIKLQFFTNISHEIRTPLTLILGPLEDLKAIPNLPAAINNPLNIMTRNGKRILRLVNQLLDFRKIQNQKMKLRVQQVEIISFVNEVCLNFEQLAFQKNINFSFPNTSSAAQVWIDKEKIDSVLFNILSNAFKFTSSNKSIKVLIEQNVDALNIIITDEGKGIAAKELPMIFKRFTTLSADDIDFSGTGIGLAYSYELIKLHHGDIKVDSTPGIGSSFNIFIPMGKSHFSSEDLLENENQFETNYSHASQYSLENIPELNSDDTEKQSEKYKITIVEDNLEVLSYLESTLGTSFNIYKATNGMEGLDIINKVQPDIVISDVMMPEMDGIEMTKKIKEDFSISHIPVIMLTAKSDINDQIIGIETGAEAYLLKPFNANHLYSVINNLLKQREILSKKYSSTSFGSEIKITNKDEEFIKNTISIIETNCQDTNFNVQELISKSNLGRTVFFNKVKGLTGSSPVEFMRKIKLDIAKKHLAENKCGVAEAAYLSGFNDAKYFAKSFKKEFGINPSEYKKS